MFGALLIHLAVIAAPATVHDATQPSCQSVHCSTTVDESAQNQTKPTDKAQAQASFDRRGYDTSATWSAR